MSSIIMIWNWGGVSPTVMIRSWGGVSSIIMIRIRNRGRGVIYYHDQELGVGCQLLS